MNNIELLFIVACEEYRKEVDDFYLKKPIFRELNVGF